MVVSLETGAGSFCICFRKESPLRIYHLNYFLFFLKRDGSNFINFLSFLSLGIGMLWHFLDEMLPMNSTTKKCGRTH